MADGDGHGAAQAAVAAAAAAPATAPAGGGDGGDDGARKGHAFERFGRWWKGRWTALKTGWKEAHWFLKLLIGPMLLGLWGAVEAFLSEVLPGAALGSRTIYAVEVFGIVFVLSYLLLLLLGFAYYGQAPRKLVLPGGAEIEPPAGGDLKQAAGEASGIADRINGRLEAQDTVLGQILDLVAPPDDEDGQDDAGSSPEGKEPISSEENGGKIST